MKKQTKLVSLNDVPRHPLNPFVLKLEGKMYLQPRANYLIAKGEAIFDKETGIVKHDEEVLIGRRKVVDKSQFAKVYASEIGILFELSKAGINMFLYLSKVMDYQNMAIFNYNIDFKLAGYKSHHSALIGLRELVTKNIIAVRDKNIYWLNPLIVCKGERFATYTEYIAADDTQRKADIQDATIVKQNMDKPISPELEFVQKAPAKIEEDYQKRD